jgi:outer membrane protein X
MKQTIIALFILCALSTNAQTFKPFKLDIAAGESTPSGGGIGILLAMEPKYAPNDNVALGLRLEATIMLGGSSVLSGNSSAAATGDYFFKTNSISFRPFAGAGIGVYSVSSGVFLESDDVTATKFGGFPRVGFEYGHFRLAVEYNFVEPTTVQLYQAFGGGTASVNNNYLGIKVGFFFGGGRK